MLILDKFHRFVRSRVVAMGGRVVMHDIEGYELHSYEIPGSGSGPPVVLLHGLGGSANSFFSILSKLRSTWRKIYLPDLPGHGFSELRPGQPSLDVLGHQRIFSLYLDRVVGEPAALVGHSMGGGIVLKTATDRPDTPAVALLCPAGAPLDEVGLRGIKDRFSGASTEAALGFLNALTHRSTWVNRLIASDMREHISARAVQDILTHTKVGGHIEEEAIRALAMPMLLIWGESEKILPAHGIEFFRRVLPSHARIEVFERCGHLPMMEHPAKTIALLEELARSLGRA